MYKVLLVEDEKMIRKGLAYNFDWIGCECTIVGEAGNGEEGVEMIRSLNPVSYTHLFRGYDGGKLTGE